MDEHVAAALEHLDVDGMIAAAETLIAIPTCDGCEGDGQEAMARLMAGAGLAVDRWAIDLPALARHPAWCAELERTEAIGLVGTLAGRGAGPRLVLNGHIDVVPPGDPARWRDDPWRPRVRGGRLYGRGACDMKAGLVAGLFAMKAWRDAGLQPPGDVALWSVVGEEDGGAGTLATIVRGHRGDRAVVMEPTDLAVIPAQAGAYSFRITVPGRSAHGALRAEGVDPLEKFQGLFAALRRFERERNRSVEDPLFAHLALPFAICIGTVRAGNWPSTVAEALVCEGRFGMAPDEDPRAACRAFEACVAAAAAADPWLAGHPPRVAWWGARFDPARTPSAHPLVADLAAAVAAERGRAATVAGAPYGADLRLLVREAGIPTVLFGPGDIRQAHATDEHVALEQVTMAARALVRLIGAAGSRA